MLMLTSCSDVCAQLDIAVALSQSASEADRASADAVREEDDMARAKRLSLTPGQASSAAEALSCKLWSTERCMHTLLPLDTCFSSPFPVIECHSCTSQESTLSDSVQRAACRAVSTLLLFVRSLNYDDVVCDGLYDPWGSFPELQQEGPSRGFSVFPSLADLMTIQPLDGDRREVLPLLGPHLCLRP